MIGLRDNRQQTDRLMESLWLRKILRHTFSEKESARKVERDRETDTARDRERQTQIQIKRQRQTEKDRERQRQR